MHGCFVYSITTMYKETQQEQQQKPAQSTENKLSQINNQHVMSGKHYFKHEDVKRLAIETEGSIEKARTSAMRTHRGDNKHQASVCFVCYMFIIGTETVHTLSKEGLLMQKHRLSVKAYQGFNN